MTSRFSRRGGYGSDAAQPPDEWILDDAEPDSLVPRADPPADGVAYADIPRRGIAFLLDVLLVQMTTTMLLQASAFVAGSTLLTGNGVTDRMVGAWLGFVLPTAVVAVLQASVFVYFWCVYQSSPGQLILGLFTVRAADGAPLSKRRAILRWIVTFMPAFIVAASSNISVIWVVILGKSSDDQGAAGLAISLPVVWFLVVLVSMLIDNRGRGLNDRVAGSVVVRVEA